MCAPASTKGTLQLPLRSWDPETRCVLSIRLRRSHRRPHLPQDVKATSEAQSPRLRLLAESPSEPKAAQFLRPSCREEVRPGEGVTWRARRAGQAA